MATGSTPLPHIVLTDDQARIIASTLGSVELRDAAGMHLGYAAAREDEWLEEDIRISKERAVMQRPGKTTAQVLEVLEKLGRQ